MICYLAYQQQQHQSFVVQKLDDLCRQGTIEAGFLYQRDGAAIVFCNQVSFGSSPISQLSMLMTHLSRCSKQRFRAATYNPLGQRQTARQVSCKQPLAVLWQLLQGRLKQPPGHLATCLKPEATALSPFVTAALSLSGAAFRAFSIQAQDLWGMPLDQSDFIASKVHSYMFYH